MKISLFIFTLLTFISMSYSIYLPLQPNRPRCMMVYTIGDVESVKIFLDLPTL